MIEFSYFKYSEPNWNKIKGVVQKALRRDADEIVVKSARMDGTKHDVTLQAKIGGTATVYLARDTAMRQMPTQLAFWKHLTALREDAERLRNRIIGSPAFWVGHNDYAPETDMLVATDVYFEKLLRNLDGIIVAIGPPRKKMGGAASKKKSRNPFWSDLLSIWCQIGGKETGQEAAGFLIAASVPVFNAMPRGAREAIPEQQSVIQWLRRRSLTQG